MDNARFHDKICTSQRNIGVSPIKLAEKTIANKPKAVIDFSVMTSTRGGQIVGGVKSNVRSIMSKTATPSRRRSVLLIARVLRKDVTV